MLSEVYLLRKSLVRTSRNLAPSHPWMKEIAAPGPGGWTAFVDANGHIARVERDTRETLRARWQIAKSNHERFPTINVKSLRDVEPDSDAFATLRDAPGDADTVAIFRRLLDEAPVAWDERALKALTRVLHEFADTLRTYLDDPTPELAAFSTLVSRVADSPLDGAAFLSELAERMLTALAEGHADAESVRAFLFGSWNRGKTELSSVATLIVLDLDDYAAFDPGIWSADAKRAVIERLLERQGTTEGEGTCSLSGRRGAVEREKFPNPTLPTIGISYLFSKNKDTPCQGRYGVIGPKSASINRELAIDLETALRHITAPERREKTWAPVPSEKSDSRDLLVVYLEDVPDWAIENAVDNAVLFGGDPLDAGQYEATTAVVCKALKEYATAKDLTIERREPLLRLFVLRKEDPGRTQVLTSEVVTVSEAFDGAESWIAGARNIPAISVPIYNAEKKVVEARRPWAPPPAAVVALLRRQWIRGGKDESDVPGAPYSDVFDVFLQRSYRARLKALALIKAIDATHDGNDSSQVKTTALALAKAIDETHYGLHQTQLKTMALAIVETIDEMHDENDLKQIRTMAIALAKTIDEADDEKPNRTRTITLHLLGLLLARYAPLFLGVGHAMHRGSNDAWDDFKTGHRTAALSAVGLAGILLQTLGKERGTYMRDAPFLVGRMLSLADTIHREYCRLVRGGDIPPQLLGNAHVAMAVDNPEKAFATMFLRLKVYQGWADTAKGDEARLAKWAVAQIRRVVTDLEKTTIPARTDDAAKVQIMLGYLALSTKEVDENEPAAAPAEEK